MNEANKTLVKRFVTEYQTNRDEAVLNELLAANVVDHSAFPGQAAGRAGVKQIFDAFHSAFSGFHAVIHDQVADSDKVVTRKTFRGTHTGEWMGIPPTGHDVEIGVIDIVRIADGQIVEHWNQVDQLGLMRQLGAVDG